MDFSRPWARDRLSDGSMRLIDGNTIAQEVLAEVKARVAKLG
jgi:hypothetical protein